MKYTHLSFLFGIVFAISSCSPPPIQEARGGVVNLPVDFVSTPFKESKNPVVVLKSFDSVKLVINSSNIFQQNNTPLRKTDFQMYSTNVFKTILDRIAEYPNTKKVDVNVYRFGNYPSAYLKELSTLQAQTICALLWDYGNLDSNTISCKGMGKNGPQIVSKYDFSTNYHNNRIEITLS